MKESRLAANKCNHKQPTHLWGSVTCDGEYGVEAAVSVRQVQPVTHLDLVSLAPRKVHQGATNITPQFEDVLVDVEILSITTT